MKSAKDYLPMTDPRQGITARQALILCVAAGLLLAAPRPAPVEKPPEVSSKEHYETIESKLSLSPKDLENKRLDQLAELKEAVVREHADRQRKGRILEVLPWLEVTATADSADDARVKYAAEQRLDELTLQPAGANGIQVIFLPQDTDSVEAAERLIPKGQRISLERFNKTSVESALALHPNGIVLLVGHQRAGRMYVDRSENGSGAPIATLMRLAKRRGTFLLPVGCDAGRDTPIGPIGILNSVAVVERIAAVLKVTNARALLEGFAGQGMRLRFNPFEFEAPTLVEVIDRQNGERRATLHIPASTAPELLYRESWLEHNIVWLFYITVYAVLAMWSVAVARSVLNKGWEALSYFTPLALLIMVLVGSGEFDMGCGTLFFWPIVPPFFIVLGIAWITRRFRAAPRSKL
jgi:hypothetical protein